jgi:hypothetical protein
VADFGNLAEKWKNSIPSEVKDASQMSKHLLLPPSGYHSTTQAGFTCSPAVY